MILDVLWRSHCRFYREAEAFYYLGVDGADWYQSAEICQLKNIGLTSRELASSAIMWESTCYLLTWPRFWSDFCWSCFLLVELVEAGVTRLPLSLSFALIAPGVVDLIFSESRLCCFVGSMLLFAESGSDLKRLIRSTSIALSFN